MSEIIRSITIKQNLPIVKFDRNVSEGSTISSVFPGSGSDPVLPSVGFENAIFGVVDAIVSEYSLSADWEWSLDSIVFDWDAEGDDYGFKAVLSSFHIELGSQKVTVSQSSPSHLPPSIPTSMESLEREALSFVRGASAQGSLFDQDVVTLPMGDVVVQTSDIYGKEKVEAIA